MALVLALGAGGAAAAGEAQDRLFALHALGGVETGQTLVYDFSRRGDFPAGTLTPVADGEARLRLAPGEGDKGRAAIAELRDGQTVIARFDPFPGDAGNPMFMVFMEEAVAGMSKITGGSSFYIRNRMREALGAQDAVEAVEVAYDGREVAARRLTFQPFLRDKNAAKMGAPFVDLAISFVMSDEVPGEFLSMEAVTGPGEGGEPLMDLKLDLTKVEEG
ncbi:MAG: hypothetical protein DI556_12720 [Rhodovulum sulfidophilum]|uniref:DUF3108 domain-containing protein n=1 Tax=Rhodovulum sulfidophilum TaxID=35806 RepID=A0A2W5NE23_RHOSU|nr:MAG: hypothetical protein DI556_12720 [Rhodovulum sulfidophilum]